MFYDGTKIGNGLLDCQYILRWDALHRLDSLQKHSTFAKLFPNC